MSTVEDLRVFGVARDLVRVTWSMTRARRNDGGLGDQMRRAAVSIASNIAEGHGRRNHREFRNFLRYARASCDELRAQAQILAAMKSDDAGLQERCISCGRMLTRLIQSLPP